MLLQAAKRGRMILFMQVFAAALTLLLATASASTGSLITVAWSLAAARIVATAGLVVVAFRIRAPRRGVGTPAEGVFP